MLEVQQQLVPALLALPITIKNRDQLLLAIGSGPHQHQQALLVVGVVFEANFRVDTVSPERHVLFLREVALYPGGVLRR
jgi:hypothetical protein